MDDLERVLGYKDYADDSIPARSVGPEMLAMSFWTPSFCSAIIRAAEAVGGFEPQADDPVPGFEISLAAISSRLFEAVQDDFGVRIWPQLQQYWPLIDYCGLRDAFVIRYEKGVQEELRMHHDVAQVSASVKLNDNYEGAQLEFPRQGITNESLKVGEMLAWPSMVTHAHRSAPITKGVKYSLTFWCEIPLAV